MASPKATLVSHRVFLTAIYFLLAGAAAARIAAHEGRCSAIIQKIAAREDFNAVVREDAEEGSKQLGFVLSFIFRAVARRTPPDAEEAAGQHAVLDLTNRLKEEFLGSLDACLVLAGFTALFLAGAVDARPASADAAVRSIYALLAVSLVFFAIGVSQPVLTAVVKGSHRIIGGFIIQTSSKGIASTVASLFHSGNWVISGLLATFSIGIPILKAVAVLSTLLGRSRERRLRVGHFLEAISRWALTDVLVAAVLLGCFSLNAIKQANGGVFAAPRFAFGFFVAYCVLAAWTSALLKRTEGAPAADTLRPGILAGRAAVLAAGLVAGWLFGVRGLEAASDREAATAAVVRLVATHVELAAGKYRAEPGHPAELAFDAPYDGTLSVEAKDDGGPPPQLLLQAVGSGGGAEPLAFSGDLRKEPRQYRVKIEAGKHRLTVNSASREGERISLRLSLDP